MTAARTLVLSAMAALAACSPAPDPLVGLRDSERTVERGPSSQGGTLARIPAQVGGKSVSWEALTPALAEHGGRAVLEELALDRALEDEFGERGLTLPEEAIKGEEDDLLRSLSPDADTAHRLLGELRAQRGLGPVRYAGLLRRNAMLRLLVADRVVVTDEMVELAYRIEHGLKVQVRLIVVPDDRAAGQLRAELMADGAADAAEFIRAALDRSSDGSAPRGGLLEPISPVDARYPQALTSVLEQLEPGVVSEVLPLESGAGLVLLERRIEGDGVSLEESRESLRGALERRERRLQIQLEAERLLGGTSVRAIDPGLAWSWGR